MSANEELDQSLAFDLVGVTEAAALAASSMIGLGDQEQADEMAVAAMREALNGLDITGTIVIGEGERDAAPMLYIGEMVGTGNGPEIDIAVDPLEGTRITAKGAPNALAVAAISAGGHLLNAPDTYMEKIAIGGGFEEGIVDLDRSAGENVKALAAAKGVAPDNISACILERPRHDEIIAELRALGCRIELIGDGDIVGALKTAWPDSPIDIYMGIGGAPEGVLAAAALQCFGGQFQARLVFHNDEEKARADRLGIKDLDRKYRIDDLATGDIIFAATGVTDGALLRGVHKCRFGGLATQSIVICSARRIIRWIESEQFAT